MLNYNELDAEMKDLYDDMQTQEEDLDDLKNIIKKSDELLTTNMEALKN